MASSHPASDSCTYNIHWSNAANLSRDGLQALAAKVLLAVETLAKDYIWQRESFNLHVANDGVSLTGSVRLGESVQDEWYIVWLLIKISSDFPEAVIEVKDNDDGQFLLIEAAEVLPKWLNPGNAENRLWIHKGQFHLVPIEYTSPVPQALQGSADIDEAGYLSQEDAIACVLDASKNTVAPSKIVTAIEARISGYPQSLQAEHYHTTIAYLPSEIIQLLAADPQLISPVVGAFYERDALQLRACQFMSRFSFSNATPSSGLAKSAFSSSKCRNVSVKMTRALYAQLVSQKFYPPKPFLKAGWFENLDESSKEYRHREVGMKLACGFEMLYQASSTSQKKGRRVDLPRGRGFGDTSMSMKDKQPYLRYIVALTTAGYFQGETPGSRLYTELENKADKYWEQLGTSESSEDGQPSNRRGDEFKRTCDAILEDTGSGNSAQPDNGELREDSDDWLYLSPESMEEMLRAKSGDKPTHAPDVGDNSTDIAADEDEDEDEKLANAQAQKLQDMADKFGDFMNAEGDLEGALFEDDALSDDEDEVDSEEEEEETVAGPSIDHTGKRKRDNEMSEVEKQDRLDKLVAPLGDSEWGAAAAAKARELNSAKEPAPASSKPSSSQPKETVSSVFHDKFDGVSDSEESEDDEMAPVNDGRKTARFAEEEDDDDLAPQVVDDEGLQFGPGEMEEFLNFTREALGLSEEQFGDIVQSRKDRGAYVPPSAPSKTAEASKATPEKAQSTEARNSKSSRMDVDDIPPSIKTAPKAWQPSQRNPNLDNFEALMEAMDSELSKIKSPGKHSTQSTGPKLARKSVSGAVIDEDNESEDDEDADDMEGLDAELAAALNRDPDDAGDGSMDYKMISNFLESFKAQAGLAGPVSNMFGRIDKDFKLPRDT